MNSNSFMVFLFFTNLKVFNSEVKSNNHFCEQLCVVRNDVEARGPAPSRALDRRLHAPLISLPLGAERVGTAWRQKQLSMSSKARRARIRAEISAGPVSKHWTRVASGANGERERDRGENLREVWEREREREEWSTQREEDERLADFSGTAVWVLGSTVTKHWDFRGYRALGLLA